MPVGPWFGEDHGFCYHTPLFRGLKARPVDAACRTVAGQQVSPADQPDPAGAGQPVRLEDADRDGHRVLGWPRRGSRQRPALNCSRGDGRHSAARHRGRVERPQPRPPHRDVRTARDSEDSMTSIHTGGGRRTRGSTGPLPRRQDARREAQARPCWIPRTSATSSARSGASGATATATALSADAGGACARWPSSPVPD